MWEGKNSSFTFDQSQSTSRWRKKWFFLFQSINCIRRRNNTGKERKSSSNWYQRNDNVTSNILFPVGPHHYVIEVWMYISFLILFCLHGVFYKFLIQCKQWQLILMGEQIDEYIFVLSYHNRAKHMCSRPLQLFHRHWLNHTIFTNKIFPPQNKHILRKCAAFRQTKLLPPDWSHFNEFKQIFQMGPKWLS